MYSIGEYVMKAGNGVCEIADIVHPDLPNIEKDKMYYLLVPQDSKNAKIYVAVDGQTGGLRPIMQKEEAMELIEMLPDIEATWIANDKMREQCYKEAIRSCNPKELVGIIKNMYFRKKERIEQGRKSTAIDDRYFKLAEDILYSEIAFAIGEDRGRMKELIAEKVGIDME